MKIISHSERQTRRIGRIIAEKLKKGSIVCLSGSLGSGKTVFTKGIAQALGVGDNEVISPTFVLIHEYGGKLPLYHFDLYRLAAARDIIFLGYEEYFYGQGISVIEWSEKLKSLAPRERLEIKFSVRSEKERVLEIRAVGDYYKKILEESGAHLRD